MNFYLKHLILAIFSVAILAGTLYIPSLAKDPEEMKKVHFGYPFYFVEKDFSLSKTFNFFPRYLNFNLKEENIPVKEFFAARFFLSFFSVFLLLEAIIYALEAIKLKIRNKAGQE